MAAFCERVRGRLDDASLAERQAILQLVVERVIVHEDNLEIRHVIPLRSPPPGREEPPRANGRLRSDRVDHVASPGRIGLGAVTGFGVVRRFQTVSGTAAPHRPQPGTTILPAPVLPVLDPLEVPCPHAAQRPDGGQHRGIQGRVQPGQRVEEPEAICADLGDVSVALGADLG